MTDQRDPIPEDRFYQHDLLGEGGMARVWRAWHHGRHCWCAIKVLSERYAREKLARRRFIDEARTMLALDHRNVIQAWEVGDGARPFLVMEVADGGSLRDWVERHGPMPPRMAVGAAIQICKGVAAAHEAGVIHRDIKPHNILINRKGVCKVTDFGIARIRRDDGSVDIPDATTVHTTTSAQGLGTVGFMAPEQQTDPRRVDVRSDVYGIGATLYYLLTGRYTSSLFMIKEDEELLEGIPQPLRPLLIRAVAYLPEERYAKPGELAYRLHELRSYLPEDPKGTLGLADGLTPEPLPPQGVAPASPSGAASELRLDDLEIPTTYIKKEAIRSPSTAPTRGNVQVQPVLSPPPLPPELEATARPTPLRQEPERAEPRSEAARPEQPRLDASRPVPPRRPELPVLASQGRRDLSSRSPLSRSRSGNNPSRRFMLTLMSEPDRRPVPKRGLLGLSLIGAGLGVLGFLVFTILGVWSYKWKADDREHDLRKALNQMMAEHYSVAQFGADPATLDALQAQALQAPEAELIDEARRYIQALETVIPPTQPAPTGPLAVAYLRSDSTLSSLKEALAEYETAQQQWADCSDSLPWGIPIFLGLAPELKR